MTVLASVYKFLGKTLRDMRTVASANNGRVQGPLRYITDYLGLDFLDDEWKRVLFLGLILSLVAFVIAFVGNLTAAHGEEKQTEESDDNDENQKEVKNGSDSEETDPHVTRTEADDDSNDTTKAAPSGAREDIVQRKIDDIADSVRKRTQEARGVTIDAEIKTKPPTDTEAAKEESIIKSIASWRLFATPQKPADGGADAFRSLLEKLKPQWWTDELSTSLAVVTDLYSRLVMTWMKTHQFKYPLPLNVLLAGLFFYDFEHEVKEVGIIDNSTLARAHYFLQFADASYASDLRSAGILRRSVIKASLGARMVDNNCLRHVLFVDHLTKSVVLMIRGTADFNDMLVDLLADEVPFMNGVAHTGLLEEAKSILAEVGPSIEPTLRMFGYRTLVLTGHSLGAGTAVLASLLLRQEYPSLKDVTLQCFVFGSPPVIGPPEAFPPDDPRLSNVEIVSFVNNADVIPRTSMFALELGMRLWIALDLIEEFGLGERLRCLMTGNIPKNIKEKVMELLKNTEDKSSFQKMIVPGKCVWLVRQPANGGANPERTDVKPPVSGKAAMPAAEDPNELIVSCPSDPLSVSTQPMFTGNTWLLDHRLSAYQRSLESV